MASSKQGSGADGGNPTRHSGRSFASMDPERQREVVPQADAEREAARHPASERAALPRGGRRNDPGSQQGGAAGGR